METFAEELIISKSCYNCGFSIATSLQKSKTIEFFDELYAYPPKFKIKWETIGELSDEPFMSFTYRALNNTFPFFDSLTNVLLYKTDQYSQKNNYSAKSYFQGFSDKLISTQFYNQKTSAFQKVLKKVPVYVILNGQGEIVLADSLNGNHPSDGYLNKISYNICGKFDPIIDQTNKLGLFFLSKQDATLYLKEVVAQDSQGTNTYGLSLHCVGLDFAYRVMREYNPAIDFRLVPDLNEVQMLLTRTNKSDHNLSFSSEQKYIRFKKLPALLVSLIYKLVPIEFPGHSTLEKVDFFKGVPIYIVKAHVKSKHFFLPGISTTFKFLESLRTSVVNGSKILGLGIGLNYNSQDQIISTKNKAKTKLFIFFEKASALNFCNNSSLKIVRNSSTGSKIIVSNLEDFLELLEEDITENKLFQTYINKKPIISDDVIEMISSRDSIQDTINQPKDKKMLSAKSIQSFVLYKYQRLQAFLELLLNFN